MHGRTVRNLCLTPIYTYCSGSMWGVCVPEHIFQNSRVGQSVCICQGYLVFAAICCLEGFVCM